MQCIHLFQPELCVGSVRATLHQPGMWLARRRCQTAEWNPDRDIPGMDDITRSWRWIEFELLAMD